MPESTKKWTCFASCFVLFRAASFAVRGNILKDSKENKLLLASEICTDLTVTPSSFARATVRFSEQIISSDNYLHISSPKVSLFFEYSAFRPSQLPRDWQPVQRLPVRFSNFELVSKSPAARSELSTLVELNASQVYYHQQLTFIWLLIWNVWSAF